jgi:hypothetical protein
MFWVNDTLHNRQSTIHRFSSREEIVVGYLLAAADFEWTIRRAILALGIRATRSIRTETLAKCHGDESYKDAWKKEVFPSRGTRLPDVVPDWHGLVTKAFPLRHRLIHGIVGAPGFAYTKERRDIYLSASEALVRYASALEVNLYYRLPVRLKDR